MKKNTLILLSVCLAMALPALAGPFATGAIAQQEEIKKVDLNRAGAEELEELPGIGEKVAERIVAYREENGRFEEPAELMNVRGIGEKTYLKLEPYLTVSGESKSKK